MTRRYLSEAAESLRIVPLDAMTAIYHRASGATHLVGSPVPELLALLGSEPMDADTLLAALARDFDLLDGDREALIARLGELEEAGLVRAG